MSAIENVDTQNKVYDFIVAYKSQHGGTAPTVREICESCGISSTAYAKYLLDRLAEQGRIVKGAGARNISIPNERWTVTVAG